MVGTESVYIAGVCEHPTREAPNKSTMQLHSEVAKGALNDAGLKKNQIDGYLTAGMPEYNQGLTPLIMADYLGLNLAYTDTTDYGGSSYVAHVGHAANAIRNGKCDIVLITLAGRPRSRDQDTGSGIRQLRTAQDSFERIYGTTNVTMYGMAAQRHMHEYGTTPEQLAEIRVAASHHAQYNEDALYPDPVSIEDVVNSRIVADSLHLLDCCVITDGGGALLVVSEEVRDSLNRECVELLGHGVCDSMETLLSLESVRKVWGARDRAVNRAREHVYVIGPCAKEAESWALQPGCRLRRQPGKPA